VRTSSLFSFIFLIYSLKVEAIYNAKILNNNEEPNAIYYSINSTECGGVFVDSDTILTAAHCLHDDNAKKMKASSIAIYYKSHSDSVYYRVLKILINPNFKMLPNDKFTNLDVKNDLALIKIQYHKTIFNRKEPPIQSYVEPFVFDGGGEKLKLISMGPTKSGIAEKKSIGLYDSFKFVASDSYLELHPDISNSVCKGDSGNGLYVLDQDGTSKLIGLTSAVNVNCGEKNQMAFVVTFNDQMDWLEKSIQELKN
jgi:hypothetical protein